MALQATTYKAELNISDMDRGVYATLRMTVARHPSETEERLAVRLLAYALWYDEALAFGRGLSDVDEPALWSKHLDGRVAHWIEVGQPDADRLTWCSRRSERVSLMTYGNIKQWTPKVVGNIGGLNNVDIVALPQEPLAELSTGLPRTISWGVMISDGVLFVSDERGQIELPMEWLKGEHR
ncbi:YaeQ family protein [Atopomonas sediminilitoris]|uniref:YaeQ family protein n=1 Tax=Atopomonas sediminilitoris TaxID=2919919 RepID=UPI001F4D7C67|nr:YaeQ family protein [Atopomonas sediminilitoris]MCJ8168956.1 YaeQ family protein [Atopomonas sediminilitoris]